MSDSQRKSARRRLLASLGGSVILCGVGLAAWWFWPESLPSPDAAPSVIAKFASSEKFSEMNYEEQQPYVDVLEKMNLLALIKAADDAAMTAEQRIAAVRNVIASRQERVMTEYFKLPEGKARLAYMDKVIDEIERAPIRPPGTGKSENKITAQQQKRRTDTITPTRQMQVAQFYTDMLARRKDRGLPNPTASPR